MGASAEDLALFGDEPAKPAAKVGAATPEDLALFDEPHVSKKPMAPFIPEQPPTFGENVKAGLGAIAQPFADTFRGVLNASDFVGRAVAHPIDTFGGGKALPVAREVMRGVNSNIPFANDAVEALPYGPPASSPQDRAAAPGASEFGGLAGAPILGGEGRILGSVGRGAKAVGEGARILGENSIARSAARGPTPIKSALLRVGDEALEKGHLTSGLVRTGAVATDEGVAAIARRLLKERTGAAPAAVAAEEAAAPTVAAAEAKAPAPALSDNPQIRHLQEALPTASPEQADMINKAIAGLERRAAAPPRAPAAAVPAGEQLAPTVAERAAAIRDARTAPNATPPVAAVPPPWTPGPTDERFAREIGLSVEKYRALMDRRNVRLMAGAAQ